MFFKKSIKITAYTTDPSYMETCQPVYKSKEKPDWLRKLGAISSVWDNSNGLYNKSGTAATCPGIREFLSYPIQLFMWADVDIRINPDGRWFHNGRPTWGIDITQHPKEQFGDAYNNRIALKLNSPWLLKSDSDTRYLFTESHYSTSYFRENGILLSPGVTNFKWQHSTNVHLNCPIREEPYVISLKHGMPLISMFPLTDKEINLECKKIGLEEYNEINQHFPKMCVGRYFKQAGYKK
jgi:hypothetical protein